MFLSVCCRHMRKGVLSSSVGPAFLIRHNWSNRIKPYLQSVWPKDRDRITPAIAESFARLTLETGGAFPEAVATVLPWLMLLDHQADYVVHRLSQSGLCARFPRDALVLLNATVNDQTPWTPTDLGKCLNDIAVADPQLTEDPRLRRLLAWVQLNQP